MKFSIKIFSSLTAVLLIIFAIAFTHVPVGLAVGSDGVWAPVPNMLIPHDAAGTILLNNGKVLETTGYSSGGYPSTLTSDSELFDPVSQTWTTTGNVNHARGLWGNAIAKLIDGRVMIAGGEDPYGDPGDLDSVELYNPTSGTWSYTGSLNTGRRRLSIMSLQDGKVLVTAGANGGPNGGRFLASTEIYDPATGQWTFSGNLNVAREHDQRIIMLHDGRVMIAGGEGPWYVSSNTAEIYDPATGQWTLTAPMLYGWGGASMTVLNDGRILVAGGYYFIPNDGTPFTSVVTTEKAMIYDPANNTWTYTGSMNSPRAAHSAALLSDGKVLVMGGSNGSTTLKSSEIYDPATGQWTLASNMYQDRLEFGLTTLPNGDILTTGGWSVLSNNVTNAAEIFTTPSNVAPTPGAITVSANPLVVNTSLAVSASFTDANTSDTHTATWDWGDGSSSTCPTNSSQCTLTEINGSGTVTGSHTYAETKVYTITLTVTDNRGAYGSSKYQYLAVYAPTSSGLFTGVRLFDNPTDAIPNTTGQVKFGISVKYDINNQPTGNVSMNFKNANLDFTAISFDYLVTSGTKAYVKGSGTLNGVSGYTFLASGIDGHDTGGSDFIRFQIKQGTITIYDSQPNAGDDADPITSVTGQVIVH